MKRIALLAFAAVAQAAPELCSNGTGSSELGYQSIAAINADMQVELNAIRNGTAGKASYSYSLCSSSVLDATDGPLRPVLQNVFFICGADGSSTNDCTILNGATQVEISSSSLAGYDMTDITFMGIQFSDFKNSSITAIAGAPAQVNFRDVMFTNFQSEFVVQQFNNGTGSVMTVDIDSCTISRGVAGTILANNGGSLRVQKLEVHEVTASALVATSNGGNSFFQDSMVTGSMLVYITETSGLGAQSVINVGIQNMTSMVNAFLVSGAGSKLSLGNSTINNNTITDTRWTAVQVQSGATATVSNSEISGNSGLAFGVAAIGLNTQVAIANSLLSENVGTAGPRLISAPVIVLSQGQVTVQSTVFHHNEQFSGSILALQGSIANMEMSCFTDSQSDYVVFIDRTSNYTESNNYIDTSSSSVKCPGVSSTLFQESTNSGCFEGSDICQGTCSPLANATSCMAKLNPTAAPVTTSVPSGAPLNLHTLVPSMANLGPTIAPVSTIAPSGFRTGIPSGRPLSAAPSTPLVAPTRLPSIPSSIPSLLQQPSITPANTVAPGGTALPTTFHSEPPTSKSLKPSREPLKPAIPPPIRPTIVCPPTMKGSKMTKSKALKGSKGGQESPLNAVSTTDPLLAHCYDKSSKAPKRSSGSKGSKFTMHRYSQRRE